MNGPDRNVLRDLVLRWQSGEVNERDVHEEAESLYESKEWPQLSITDYDSIAIEVMSHLEILNHELITPADAPAILRFLGTPRGKERSGWREWSTYWNQVDYEARKRELAGNPYYAI